MAKEKVEVDRQRDPDRQIVQARFPPEVKLKIPFVCK